MCSIDNYGTAARSGCGVDQLKRYILCQARISVAVPRGVAWYPDESSVLFLSPYDLQHAKGQRSPSKQAEETHCQRTDTSGARAAILRVAAWSLLAVGAFGECWCSVAPLLLDDVPKYLPWAGAFGGPAMDGRSGVAFSPVAGSGRLCCPYCSQCVPKITSVLLEEVRPSIVFSHPPIETASSYTRRPGYIKPRRYVMFSPPTS